MYTNDLFMRKVGPFLLEGLSSFVLVAEKGTHGSLGGVRVLLGSLRLLLRLLCFPISFLCLFYALVKILHNKEWKEVDDLNEIAYVSQQT